MSPSDSPNENTQGSPGSVPSNGKGHEKSIDSLGVALAGMQMGGAAGATSNYSSNTVSTASSPFAIARDNDWGNFTEAASAAFPSGGNTQAAPARGGGGGAGN